MQPSSPRCPWPRFRQQQQQQQQQKLYVPFLQQLLLLLLLIVCSSPCRALRHSFITENDRRSLIGPVGVPFGFAGGGRYELTVHDFELTLVGKNHNNDNNNDSNNAAVKGLTAGFFLHRFHNDAAYTKYFNGLQSNSTACAFDYFLDHNDDEDEETNDDLSMFAEVGDIASAEHGILLMMTPRVTKWKPQHPSIDYTFAVQEAGLYFLTYQICINLPNNNNKDAERAAALSLLSKHDVRSSFELDFHFLNVDPITGQFSYLTVGEMRLPFLFFFYSVSYLVCFICWIMNMRNIAQGGSGLLDAGRTATQQQQQQQLQQRPVIYPIHKLMAALLAFKFLSVFFESLRYHAIRITGHSELWSVAYYTISFVKGIFLFTVILLIGTGWSFVKPFLNVNEKRIIFSILVLQVINNLAIAVLSQETAGEQSFDRWNAILHLVDIICCCAVLLPIVWQVQALEKSLPQSSATNNHTAVTNNRMDEHDLPDEDEEQDLGLIGDATNEEEKTDVGKAQILSKLKIFRSFYLLVVAYIYLTRIILYLFATLLDYRHLWIRYAVVELVTLSFYVIVGILFRPMVENPYLSIRQEDDDRGEETGIALPTRKKGTFKA